MGRVGARPRIHAMTRQGRGPGKASARPCVGRRTVLVDLAILALTATLSGAPGGGAT